MLDQFSMARVMGSAQRDPDVLGLLPHKVQPSLELWELPGNNSPLLYILNANITLRIKICFCKENKNELEIRQFFTVKKAN